jgi:hypothetical protein
VIIDDDQEITFYNVTITVPLGGERDAAKNAYTKLCEALASIGADWETDTFTTSTDPKDGHVSTDVLFPEEEKL